MNTTLVFIARLVKPGPLMSETPCGTQYLLRIKHTILFFSWEEEYFSTIQDLPGCWEWWRVEDRRYMTKLWLQDILDKFLCDHLEIRRCV